MILDQFVLSGKVAIVTGCSTGLGQGMSYGLAEAGADIVGIDYVDFPETETTIKAMGKRFLGIKADRFPRNRDHHQGNGQAVLGDQG